MDKEHLSDHIQSITKFNWFWLETASQAEIADGLAQVAQALLNFADELDPTWRDRA